MIVHMCQCHLTTNDFIFKVAHKRSRIVEYYEKGSYKVCQTAMLPRNHENREGYHLLLLTINLKMYIVGDD